MQSNHSFACGKLSALELSKRAKDLLENPRTTSQSKALQDFLKGQGQLKTRLENVSRWNCDTIDLADDIMQFGVIFFGGSLQGINFSWVELACYGNTALSKSETISLQISPEHKKAGCETIYEGILSTLLHECAHCYFLEMGCTGGCSIQACKTRNYEENGEGHGSAWHILAEAVERKATAWLGIAARLGRETAAQVHWKETGRLLSDEVVAICWPGQMLKVREKTVKKSVLKRMFGRIQLPEIKVVIK